MTIKPLADNVVIKATVAEETTKSGIVLTSASKEKPQIAEVVAELAPNAKRIGLENRKPTIVSTIELSNNNAKELPIIRLALSSFPFPLSIENKGTPPTPNKAVNAIISPSL